MFVLFAQSVVSAGLGWPWLAWEGQAELKEQNLGWVTSFQAYAADRQRFWPYGLMQKHFVNTIKS